MWEVKIEDEAAKVFEGKELTKEDRIVIQKWAQIVVKHGPGALRLEPTVWADHGSCSENFYRR